MQARGVPDRVYGVAASAVLALALQTRLAPSGLLGSKMLPTMAMIVTVFLKWDGNGFVLGVGMDVTCSIQIIQAKIQTKGLG